MDRPTDAQYRVLKAIEQQEGHASLGTIQKALGLASKNTVAKHVAALIKMGYVTKSQPIYDTLRLTDKAR